MVYGFGMRLSGPLVGVVRVFKNGVRFWSVQVGISVKHLHVEVKFSGRIAVFLLL